ncbi:HNH endonuclease [Salmonella enterica]|nr:HNH endonuclease [Salmonella enterica]EIG9537040.1 HNH endonuclease [Salmonella enterica]EIH0809697.1 HNH endonuclease [Salmonella enterica]EIH2228449.1 HNH endonuclease [Salmonella enterica]EIH3860536.1 HNH endonuclease [Salmonella enterica]
MARFIYTPEMKAWMQDNYLLRMDKLSVAFNAHFGTTRSSESLNGLRKRLKLRTGRRGCFTPGSIPANKGTRGVMKANRGSFKKGNRPGNTARVGDETLTEDGYIRVKVAEPNRWELKHRLVWEKYRGEIPENGVIRFIDDNGADKNGDNTPAAGYKIKQQTWTALT